MLNERDELFQRGKAAYGSLFQGCFIEWLNGVLRPF